MYTYIIVVDALRRDQVGSEIASPRTMQRTTCTRVLDSYSHIYIYISRITYIYIYIRACVARIYEGIYARASNLYNIINYLYYYVHNIAGTRHKSRRLSIMYIIYIYIYIGAYASPQETGPLLL